MRLREVGLSVAAGLAILVIGVFVPFVRGMLALAFEGWYIGAAALVAAIVVGWSGRSADATRVLGLIGIAWLTMVGAAIGVVIFQLLSSPGY
jgi:hypothetical protein